LMEQDAAQLVSLLNEGGHVYICGDGSKMAPEVTETLIKNYQTIQQTSYQKAVDWLDVLEKEGRFAKDVWAGN
jgi:cytochrome P450 / NADPH-cytochrome P450 reductase